MKTGVQIRLMGEDAASVEAVAAKLHEALEGAFVVTGRAPIRRGPGMRLYATLVASAQAGEAGHG